MAEIEKLHMLSDDKQHLGWLDDADSIERVNKKTSNRWHLQSEEDIDDSFNDWELHYFVCRMKDGSLRKFTGCWDECSDGSINIHVDCVDDDYDWEYDDIIYWIEVTNF